MNATSRNLNRQLKRRDALLILIGTCAERREFGRTSLQKVAYFAHLALDLDFGHRAHFYGPFSEVVESDIEALALSGLIEERVENLGFIGSSGFQGRRYEYRVTEDGEERLKALCERYAGDCAEITLLVQKLIDAAGGLDQRILSTAAKTHYISAQEGSLLSVDDIRAKAKRLGWDLSARQIKQVEQVLEKLGLVELH
jgi:uncharacterized protein YwgA